MERHLSNSNRALLAIMTPAVLKKYRALLNRISPRGKDRRISINSVISPFLDRRKKLDIDRRK